MIPVLNNLPSARTARLALPLFAAVLIASAMPQGDLDDPLLEPSFYRSPLSVSLIAKAQGDSRLEQINLRIPGDPLYGGFRDSELDDGRRLRRGLILTPYQRVALCADAVRGACPAEVVQRIAGPELWIVAFPYSRDRARALVGDESSWDENPRMQLDHIRVPHSAKIFWPKNLILRTRSKPRRVIEPLWLKTAQFPFTADLYGEWLPNKSIVAAFQLDDPAIVDRSATILLEGELAQNGRHSPRETEYFSLAAISERAWRRALRGQLSRTKR